MTSAVMSSQPAGSLYIQTQERSDVVEEEIQSQATVHQQLVHPDGFALRTSSRGKSSRKHLKPTTGQPAASISSPAQPVASFAHPVASSMYQSQATALCISSRDAVAMESSRKKADVVESYNSVVKVTSRSDEPAAKQLTIYE
ncbi:hypothetical protein F511_24018 [Dorcoceras hygrometricum]|uniref:Uncharacterized protein n=1 Tax=Dorcoceras hygrometricum TaxID=472368 RepID=A0A2Z7AVX9_9LAMI|nr:hypothetical protein F511_24018 [Dorcoceras hygrometricum]